MTGIVEAGEAFVSLGDKGSQAWERMEKGLPAADRPDRKARKRGGKAAKRGLLHERVPVPAVADRSGTSACAVLPADSGDAVRAVHDPILGKDALPVTGGGKAPARCATGRKVTHEALNLSAGGRVRGELHIRTADSLRGRLAGFLGRRRRGRRRIPRRLPAMAPPRRHRTRPRTPRLPRCRRRTAAQGRNAKLTPVEPFVFTHFLSQDRLPLWRKTLLRLAEGLPAPCGQPTHRAALPASGAFRAG